MQRADRESMRLDVSTWVAALMTLAVVFSGCLQDVEENPDKLNVGNTTKLAHTIPVEVLNSIGLNESIVTAAIGYASDLYEPTMEVSDSGVIYVTGHTIGADTTGAPVFFSKDDGATWAQLPFLLTATMPADMHGATPPPSDEIFLVAGDNGQLWGVDITLLTFPVNGWCNNGGDHCYHNPNAYDPAQAMTSRADAVAGESSSCSLLNLNDRPWAAYGNGKLLMVNNPGGGPVQVGIMDVPPANLVGGPTVGPTGATWNLCAGAGGGAIPGIPDMRDDHFFAVPQVQRDQLVIVKGHDGDVMNVQQVHVLNNTNTGGGTSNYGQVVFDADGTMFLGIRNNTKENSLGERTGQLQLAVSTDDGESFVTRTLVIGTPTTSIYLDGNMNGPGALLTWAQEGETRTDWYVAHLALGPNGEPQVSNVSLVVDEGPAPSAHVQGAALGPDGRAHIVTFHGGYGPLDRATPLHVWSQSSGPTLPVAAVAADTVA